MKNSVPWMLEGLNHCGVQEVKGGEHHPLILEWWKTIKRGGIKDDETAWCAAFVGAMLERCGVVSTRFEGAKSYCSWGTPLDRPCYGAILVFKMKVGHHVGFAYGMSRTGKILVLGGNQKDRVWVDGFDPGGIIACRWPEGVTNPGIALQVMEGRYSPVSTR